MENWIKKLDAFLKFNEKELLQGKGGISQEVAKQFADTEFEKYSKEQDRLFESDFDNFAKKLITEKGYYKKLTKTQSEKH